MAEDDFKRFKKRYESGKIEVLANPPPLPGPAGLGRAVVGKAIQGFAKRIGRKADAKSKEKTRKSDSGTFTSRVEATKKRERTPREKEQFGPLAKRPSSEVTKFKRPGGPVQRYERPGGPVTKYERPGGPVTKYERPGGALTRAGGKEDARVVGLSTKAKIGLAGAAAAGAGAGYISNRDRKEGRAEAGPVQGETLMMRVFGGARPERPGSYPAAKRKAAGTHTKSYDIKSVSVPKPSSKPRDAEAKPAEAKPAKEATDKSRLAPKLTNYQRMQAKQLEKEGYAGRSLTRAQAKKMAGAKSSSNTSSLMSLFGISKKKTETPKATTPKRLTSDFAKKNLAANQKIGKSK